MVVVVVVVWLDRFVGVDVLNKVCVCEQNNKIVTNKLLLPHTQKPLASLPKSLPLLLGLTETLAALINRCDFMCA